MVGCRIIGGGRKGRKVGGRPCVTGLAVGFMGCLWGKNAGRGRGMADGWIGEMNGRKGGVFGWLAEVGIEEVF